MAEIKNMLSLLIKSPARGELNYGWNINLLSLLIKSPARGDITMAEI
jgi:hypothetical protein